MQPPQNHRDIYEINMCNNYFYQSLSLREIPCLAHPVPGLVAVLLLGRGNLSCTKVLTWHFVVSVAIFSFLAFYYLFLPESVHKYGCSAAFRATIQIYNCTDICICHPENLESRYHGHQCWELANVSLWIGGLHLQWCNHRHLPPFNYR